MDVIQFKLPQALQSSRASADILNFYEGKTGMPVTTSVFLRTLGASCMAVLGFLAGGSLSAQEAVGTYELRKQAMNENVVTIIASGTVSPYTKMAEDIQNVVDEPKTPNGLRVLPILGRGGAHNALDVLLLKGVDIGVLEQDDINTAKKDEPTIFANADQRIQYITKLANSEFQIVAGKDIKTIKDLAGKKVNFLKKLSSTDIACQRIFSVLKIDVEPVYLDQEAATEKLRNGEIAAFARYAPAPHGAFASLKAADGYHLLGIDTEVVSDAEFAQLLKFYSPALLKNDTYPNLVPADKPVTTVAGSLLLAIYAWPTGTERYQRAARFVKKFFDNIEQFKSGARHPKWKEINLAYDVPGWTRFKPAKEWLDAHKTAAKPAASDDMRGAFEEFMGKQMVTGSTELSPEQREAMFKSFMEWWKSRKTQQRPAALQQQSAHP